MYDNDADDEQGKGDDEHDNDDEHDIDDEYGNYVVCNNDKEDDVMR